MDAGINLFGEKFEILNFIEVSILRLPGESLIENFTFVGLNQRRDDVAGIYGIIFGGVIFGLFRLGNVVIWLLIRSVDERAFLPLLFISLESFVCCLWLFF